jgi:hypothetical protein
MRRFLPALLVLLAFPAAAVEVPVADGWVLTSGYRVWMQDSYDHSERDRGWAPKTTPPVLQAGMGATPGMRGAQAIYLMKDNGFPQTWAGAGTLLPYTLYGSLERRIPMAAWSGKRVRLSLRTRADGAGAWIASQWGNSLNPMSPVNPATGHTITIKSDANGWVKHQLVFDVPNGTVAALTVGMGITGKGTAWLDDFRIEAVDADVPVPRCALPAHMIGAHPRRAPHCWQSMPESPS